MKTLTLPRRVNAGRLAAALAALPGLSPETRTVDGEQRQYARFTLSTDGASTTLTVPDNFDESRLAPVLAAHDPTPDPEPVNPRAALLAAVQNAGTIAELKAAVVAALERALR